MVNSNTVKNYFPVPNAVYSLGLSSSEVSIYGHLLSLENRRTYQCDPSYATIGKAVGLSKNTVSKYIGMLAENGLITAEPTNTLTKDGRKMNGSLLYTIRPIRKAVELHHQRQLRELEDTVEQGRIESLAEERGVQLQRGRAVFRPALPLRSPVWNFLRVSANPAHQPGNRRFQDF